jgi:hypothetical protein
MSSRIRRRPPPPSRAKRNIRWAAVALLALSLAPAGSPDRAAPDADPAFAAETQPTDELPWIAGDSGLDHALDLGADAIPLE